MTTAPNAPVPRPDRTQRRSAVLLVMCLVQFVVLVNAMFMIVTLPAIQHDLRFEDDSLTWVVNAYTLPLGGFLLLGGRSADLFGRKRVFVTGLALFSAASALCGLSTTQTGLLAFRALQGLGAALLAPAALSILTTTFSDGPERRKALAVWSTVNAGSSGVGLLLGGVLTATVSWPFIFLLNGIVGATILLVSSRIVPESRVPGVGGFDLGGAVTVTAGMLALVYTVLRGRQHGWDDPVTLGACAAAILSLAAFVLIQRIRRAPLVRLDVFRLRTLTAANATMFLVAGAPATVFYLLTIHLQEALDYSPLTTAFALLPAAATVALGSLLAPRLLPRHDPRVVLVVALALVALGVTLLARVGPGSDYLSEVLPALCTMFLGCSCAILTLFMLATTRLPESDAGLASGLINTTLQVGSGLWLAVLSSLAALRSGLTPGGYTVALWGVALLAASAALVVLVLLRRKHVSAADLSEADRHG
ncbi:MFS transporter [Prauserella endophytica]|uniref:MFS transporter n=1 Tax=Prauserella endophytica TaxID=1592324 RepID=A0ABY2RZE1_9PSEU|nr:MFS transporter [Prauserella endophytica]TKG66657.1 MFS transporter [Prauserella endophytica]